VLDARRLRLGLLAAAALGAAAALSLHAWRHTSAVDDGLRKAHWMEDVMFGRAPIGGPFTLTDTKGQRRSLEDFRGRIVLLYFGYTYCPDVCPTDLMQVAAVLSRLGPEAERVQALFVTFDPERDTPKHLHSYLKDFDPRLIGLTGTPEEIATAARLWRVYYAKVPMADGNYLIDHTAYTFVIDQEGHYAGVFPPGSEAERMLVLIRSMLR
jgi:protein SCO1/2